MSGEGSVFIVDDKDSMLKMLSTLLGNDWNVETFRSASQALERFRRSPADLVLTDIRMPDMDGMELLQTVKREAPNTEVILMTAFGSVGTAVEAMMRCRQWR